MKAIFTNSYFNKTFRSLLAFCVVLLMSINASAQVTATENCEDEAPVPVVAPFKKTITQSGIKFNLTGRLKLSGTAGGGLGANASSYFIDSNDGPSGTVTGNIGSIAIDATNNPSTAFKVNSFAAYLGNSWDGNTNTAGSVTFIGTKVDNTTVSATVAVPANPNVQNGLTFTGTALDGIYLTSIAISLPTGVQYIELDDFNFTTQAIVTNQFSINDVSMLEGNSGTSIFQFTVSRTVNTAAGSVQIQSSNGTATSGSDYLAVPATTVNFTAGGALTQTVNVTVNGDATIEPDETFTMTLSSPTGGVISDATGIGTILDDDASIETFETEADLATSFSEATVNFQSSGKFRVNTASGLGATNSNKYLASTTPFATGNQGAVTVTSSGKSINMLSVDLWTANVVGATYTPTTATVTFTGTKADGTGTVTHSASITPTNPSGTGHIRVNFAGTPFANVPILSIAFSISSGVNYLQVDNFSFVPQTISGTQVSIDDVSILEGTGFGTSEAVFTVTRTSNSTAFSVDVASSNGTATAGTDYTAVNTTLNFTSGGALTQTVSVPILKDGVNEPNETFNMTLSNATNGTVYLKQVGIGTINNDDGSIGETFEDETASATTFTENSVAFSATGGYEVKSTTNAGSGSSAKFLTSNNNVVGSMGTFSVTTPNTAFKIVSLDAWVGTSTTAFSSGPVTFTGTLLGGGTVSTTKTITATNNTGTGWQQGITFTGTPLDNVNLTALQITTGGSLKACDIDNFNFTIVNTLPVIEVTDASNNAITNGGAAGTANNTDFGLRCLTGQTQSKTYTIKNTGLTNLTLSGSPLAVLGGADASEFSITTQPTSPIAPGGSTTFTVLFDPSTGGPRNATITFTSNDTGSSPYTINIRGTGGFEPTVTLGASPAICAGATSFTIPFSDLTFNPTSYSVSGTGITTVINQLFSGVPSPFVVNLSSPAVFGTNPTYTLTVMNGNGCISPNYTGSVTVNAAPAATASSNSPICVGGTINLTGGGVGTYAWTGPNSFTSTDQNPSIANATTAATGTYTITVNNGICTSTATTLVTVSALPTITVSASPAICEGATSFTIPYTSTTGTPTTYSISGTGITTVTNGAFPASSPITVNLSSPASGSSYSYTLTVRNANGCISNNVTGNVSVNPAPTITTGASPDICAGATSFTIPYSATTGTPTTYSISGTGITTVTNGAFPASSPITVNLGAPSTGVDIPYTLTVRNAGGCTSSNVTGTVIANPRPTITTSASPAICAGATTFTIPYTATTNSPTTYSISGAGITTVTDAAFPASSPITINLISGATGSSISYTLTVKNANGCTSSNVTGSVTVNPLPTITKSTSPAICEGATTFTIPYTATTGTPTLYSISGSGITTVTDASLPASPITVNLDGGASGSSISYILIVRNANGCLSNNVSGSVTVNSTPAPTAPTATPASRTTAGSVTLSASGCSGGTLTWYNASTNVAVPSPNNQPSFSSSGTYNFYAKCTGTNTCVSNASTNVSVAVTLCTPLASSPGNVGINWTGLESTDWNNACNWSPAWVPDATNSAVVIGLQTNQPTISGTVPSVKLIYVNSGATLTVSSGGTLNASGTAGVLTLQGGNLINDGTVNVSGGGSGVGISIGATANITNRGTINTNNLYGISLDFGNLTFTNESTGIVNGDFKANTNILNLTNHGTINYTSGTTYALSLGSSGSSVINDGTISITVGSGISNPSGSTITNNACGKILMTTDLYENGGTTINAGLIQMPNLYNFTNTGTFTNNGVLKANTVSGITNNRMVITNACPIFTLAGSNNYTVSGIFTDAGATTSAGTYVSVGNKFTANNTIPTGTQVLYAQVTNGTCTFVVPFNFNNVKPTAVAVNNTTICPNGSVTLSGNCTAGTLTWYTTATGGSNIGTGNNLSQSPTATTTYYASCETTNCVSGRVATNTVSISSLPEASASSNSPICAGATLNLTGGSAGNTYAWTGPNSFTSTAQSPSIANATALATGTYKITVTNSTNCTATANVVVTVNAVPTATASSNSPICEGNSISLTGGGVGTYAWSGPNSFSSTAQSPTIASATILASGTYTIVVTNPSNCTSTATTSVTVNSLATVNVTPSTQTICSGEAITTIAISGTGTSYTWTRDNTGSVTGIAASGSGNISGSLTNITEAPITVTFTITPVGSCNGTPITATVIVNPTPTVTASTPSQSICSGTSITGITFNNPPAFGPKTPDPSSDIVPTEKPNTSQAIAFSSFVSGTVFNWTRDNTATVTGSIGASGTGNISGFLTNTTASPVTVTFTVTPSYTNAGKACTGTPITVTVTVNPNPTATITDGGTAFCSGSSATLSAPADPNYTYAWQRSLTGIATPNEFTAFGGTAQTQVVTTSGVYRVIVTNQYNCSARDTTAVKFGDFVFNGSLATGDAQQTGRMNRFAAVSTCAAPKGYPGDFTTTGSRLYDSYTVTNPTSAPVCATIGLTSGCGTSLFSAAYLGSFNPTSLITNYLADHGSSFPNTAFYEATIPANGTIVVVVHETNTGTGCSSYNLRIDVPGATVAPTASSNSPICAGNTLNLTGTGTGTYAWTGPNNFTSSAQNPSIDNATTLATGTYTISVTNTNNCVFNATTVVTVNSTPMATASSSTPAVCTGNTISLTGGGIGTYAWAGPNSFTSTAQSPTITNATTLATGTYTITVTNANNCTSTATVSVMVNTSPTATASSNSPVCVGNTINLLGGGLSVPTLAPSGSYAWTGPNSFSSSLQNPSITSATTSATGTYQLVITNDNGCTAMATTAVTVNALPIATASSNSPVCAGSTLSLSASGGTSYVWTGVNSFSSTEQNPNIASATTLATGTYQVIVTNANGCTAIATTSAIVNALPTATASSNSPICSGTTLSLSASGGVSYAWSGVNSFSSTQQNPTVLLATIDATGTYQVIVTNAAGCTAIATTSAIVNPTPVTPTTQANTQIIFGGSVTLTATGCSNENDVLKWYQSADNVLVTMPVSPTVTSNYYAKCETTLNGITCISPQSADVTVTVLSPTPPVATGGTTCISTPLSLTATGCSGSTGTFELKWYQNSDNTLVTMPVSPSVTTDYYAKCEQTFNSITAVSDKSNVVTLTVLNPAIPVATGATIYNGNSTTLTATGCTGEGFIVKWYETTTNNLVTMPVSPTVTTLYYAKCEQTANTVTCISGKSDDVTVTVVNRIFVDITKVSAPIQNGNSWATAYGNLQTGLAAATAGVEVWVAKGTYKPTNTTTRTIYFNIPNSVIVYGGFAGTEDALSERNFRTNVSILSGDIGNQGDITDNSYHVVLFNGSSNSTVLNGFTITGGNASFNPNRTVNLPLTNVTSTTTIESGGGIALQNAAMPMIVNCTINSNSSIFGGGLFAGDASKPTILFCKFMGNQATFGAGIYLQDGSHATISNTLISGNRGVGGLYNNYSNPTITNTTFSGNGGYNGGIFNSNSQPVVKNSIIWGNSTPFNDTQSIITNSIIQGGYAGVGNLNYDPKFVNQAPEGLSPNLNGDYHLQASSLGIDRGDNGSISLTDLDLDGNLRRYNGGRVDIGAYEFQGNGTASVVISIASGNWEINSTWDVNRVPQVGDIVIIDQNHIVTLNGEGSAKNIEYRGTGTLKFNSTSSKLNIGF